MAEVVRHRRRSALRGSALAVTAIVALGGVALGAPATAAPSPASSVATGRPAPPAPSTSTGYGGAVSSVDAEASRIGLEVLRKGGNAADAAVATAAALGVTEPYSAGIGGGGYFVYFDAESGEVTTIDGRETAPAEMPSDAFVIPGSVDDAHPFGVGYAFNDAVSSGLSVGVPGTLATWETALDEFGTRSLKDALKPAINLATKGFVVDQTFRNQTLDQQARFAQFPETAELFLPDGDAPEVGSVFKNLDLAATLRQIALRGTDVFYDGPIADEIAAIVQHPDTSPTATLPAYPGFMTDEDLADYEVILRDPTHVDYRGLDVYGMAPSSSGGTTVGESLNILENFDLSADDPIQALHLYFEATALAFADRGAYVGDPAFVDVPTETLRSQEFADARACEIDPDQAAVKPVPAGDLAATGCETVAAVAPADRGLSTTHLSVVDRWGNAVAYTLTIEQTGGSGMTVPDRGFLLNNELTDFSFLPNPADPNIVEPGKRPRSSMSPTIVLDGGDVRYVLGSPGGSTIITTVVQILLNRIDLGMTLPEAVAAPRAAQRNTTTVQAEAAFRAAYESQLTPYGHVFSDPPTPIASPPEIGAAAAIEVDADGLMTAVAEPVRRGGGTGLVLEPAD
ncbi:gamma-glutamyltranspeptidase/glutathione hydrolase [Agromyces flavus]|uniref:Glutathione hydrolase proenzyme n=1 Tax=Agromyces flavus TaxID=589382 RepID=A0A1H1ZFN9_9MICO|nr:gamma-glutamyltransferase [Agromyces flavus]MCP2367070.1 gamma-glutamyltranspeptidase/glutathione hydrolase [Agromyces flavus]GGI46460.1 gamma-glutamyltranspeptidase [Agromyces flavus]SDT32463.1 gamma-glutamyltranspeptidase / glutathione hydrolase [Agromyces flavus]